MTVIEVRDRGPAVVGIRAANPGPFTLTGTNSWIVGRGSVWLIDPGPALEEHLESLQAEIERRGELAGIALTHDHPDHAEAVPAVRDRFPGAELAAARDGELVDGSKVGPFEAVATPGHAPDHLSFVIGDVGFTGDAVLGEGSVFISPDPGAMAGYLEGLRRLRARELAVLCPGHGPVIEGAEAVREKLDGYIAHRLDRERRLIAAIDSGLRSAEDLLDAVWDDAPAILRPAAAVTLAAHLDKLRDEGRLAPGVERPQGWAGAV